MEPENTSTWNFGTSSFQKFPKSSKTSGSVSIFGGVISWNVGFISRGDPKLQCLLSLIFAAKKHLFSWPKFWEFLPMLKDKLAGRVSGRGTFWFLKNNGGRLFCVKRDLIWVLYTWHFCDCDLFWDAKKTWPFQWLSCLVTCQTRGSKGRWLNHLAGKFKYQTIPPDGQLSHEKKPCYFPLYWLFNGDP